jgi:uncharacterized protein YciI
VSELRFDRFTLVLLRRPPDAPDLPEEELDALQEQHLAHLQAMRQRGALAAAGPFDDRTRRDESLRGLCIYTTDVDETRRLAAQDPAVIAGRMLPEVLSWLVPSGEHYLSRV